MRVNVKEAAWAWRLLSVDLMPKFGGLFQRVVDRREHASRPTALVIIERNPGVCLEARFALAAEHPDHDPHERNDKDKKVDCRIHGYFPCDRPVAAPLRGTETAAT
jgi:hypothetical protein